MRRRTDYWARQPAVMSRRTALGPAPTIRLALLLMLVHGLAAGVVVGAGRAAAAAGVEAAAKEMTATDVAGVVATETNMPREIQQDGVKLRVEARPERPRLSDQVRLTIIVRTGLGVEVAEPEFGEELGDFRVREVLVPPPRLGSEEDVYRYEVILEPLRPGTARVLPIPINFRLPGGGASAKEGGWRTIESPALTLPVTSVVEARDVALADVERLDGPLAPPRRFPILGLAAGGGLLLGLGGLAGWFFLRSRRQAPDAAGPSPREGALHELRELERERLAERDVKLFFVRLTSIVRVYIERSTGVMAAEQTTDEFLREVREGKEFSASDRERLRRFLESADIVKFAGHRPRAEDVEAALADARAFVLRERQVSTGEAGRAT